VGLKCLEPRAQMTKNIFSLFVPISCHCGPVSWVHGGTGDSDAGGGCCGLCNCITLCM
jgi:hypothetical protein